MEYILRGKQDFLTSKLKLPNGSTGNANDVQTKIDPDTQARLEALLEAAGGWCFMWMYVINMYTFNVCLQGKEWVLFSLESQSFPDTEEK